MRFTISVDSLLVVAIVSGAIIYYVNRLKFKVSKFNKRVANILSFLPPDKYEIFNNVIIKTMFEKIKIEHIIISQYGIFILKKADFESTKPNIFNNYPFSSRVKFVLKPFKKDYVSILSKRLKVSKEKFILMKIIPDNSPLDTDVSRNIVSAGQINRVIEQYNKVKFLGYEIVDLINKMNNNKKITFVDKTQDILNRANNMANKYNLEQKDICPLCGHKLILKNKQYKCSNYPRCYFKKSSKR